MTNSVPPVGYNLLLSTNLEDINLTTLLQRLVNWGSQKWIILLKAARLVSNWKYELMNLGYVLFPLHHSALPKCRTTSLSKEQKIILSLLPFRKYIDGTWSNLWATDSNPSLKEKNHIASWDYTYSDQ